MRKWTLTVLSLVSSNSTLLAITSRWADWDDDEVMNKHFPPKKRSSKVGGATDGSGRGRKKVVRVRVESSELEEEEDENSSSSVLRSRLIMLDSCWEPMRGGGGVGGVGGKTVHQTGALASHSCSQCHKSFSSAGKLHQHTFVHTGERPFRCHECEKGFSSRFKLMRHALIHSNDRRYKCSYCERCFHRKDHLKNHLQVHNPNKKVYKCEQCLKEYNSRLSYRKHVAFHAAEAGDLECKVCGKRFSSTEEILYHLKVHTGSRAVKSPNEKKFKCEFCERRFFTRKDVKRHLVVHTGRRDFLCQFCPQKFGRKDHLVRHIKKSHNSQAPTNHNNNNNNNENSSKLNETLIRHHQEAYHYNSVVPSLSTSGYTLNPEEHSDYLVGEEKHIKNEFHDNSSTSLIEPQSPTSMYLMTSSMYPSHAQQMQDLDEGLDYAKMYPYDQVIKREKGDDREGEEDCGGMVGGGVGEEEEENDDTLVDQIDISQLLEFMPYTNSPLVITPIAQTPPLNMPLPPNSNINVGTSHVTMSSNVHFSGSVTPLPQFNQAFQ